MGSASYFLGQDLPFSHDAVPPTRFATSLQDFSVIGDVHVGETPYTEIVHAPIGGFSFATASELPRPRATVNTINTIHDRFDIDPPRPVFMSTLTPSVVRPSESAVLTRWHSDSDHRPKNRGTRGAFFSPVSG
jgi:hypothetical protein